MTTEDSLNEDTELDLDSSQEDTQDEELAQDEGVEENQDDDLDTIDESDDSEDDESEDTQDDDIDDSLANDDEDTTEKKQAVDYESRFKGSQRSWQQERDARIALERKAKEYEDRLRQFEETQKSATADP